jgi:hypothetical protein
MVSRKDVSGDTKHTREVGRDRGLTGYGIIT